MEILVYEKPEESPTPPPLILKLIQDGKSVRLVIVDRKGNRLPGGIICEITPVGTIRLFSGLDKEFGLSLDFGGRIKIAD